MMLRNHCGDVLALEPCAGLAERAASREWFRTRVDLHGGEHVGQTMMSPCTRLTSSVSSRCSSAPLPCTAVHTALLRRAAQLLRGQTVLLARLGEQERRERRNVFGATPERRQIDANGRQELKELLMDPPVTGLVVVTLLDAAIARMARFTRFLPCMTTASPSRSRRASRS